MLHFFFTLTTAVRKDYLLTLPHLHPKRRLSAVSNRKPDKQVAQTDRDWFFAEVKDPGGQGTLEVVVLLSVSGVWWEGFSGSFPRGYKMTTPASSLTHTQG